MNLEQKQHNLDEYKMKIKQAYHESNMAAVFYGAILKSEKIKQYSISEKFSQDQNIKLGDI